MPSKASPRSRRAAAATRVYELAEPRADAMLESLRAFGYNLPTAVADLLDNSLTAGATRINVHMEWAGPDSWLRVTDNGCGMDESTLRDAMRPGTRNPREERNPKDLGRFGLGLKTASLSQARRLTVQTRAEGHEHFTRCWDLDFVQLERKWALLTQPYSSESEAALGELQSRSGTTVLWEVMDRVVGDEAADDEEAHRAFLDRIEHVRAHLGLVFHRWISPPRPVRITVNGAQVAPWDPFMSDHPAGQHLPEERFGSGPREVRIQPFILPHQSKLKREDNGGPDPRLWAPHQGFYIYRNRRLLVAGDWLGFYRVDELHQLARIRVDIGNALDDDWKIDVRKAQAHPPDATRRRLRQIADATRAQAAEVYRHRGKVLERQSERAPISYAWLQTKRRGKIIYKVNREHPLIAAILTGAMQRKRDIESALRLVEETIPVNFILGTFREHAEAQPQPYDGADAELENLIRAVAQSYRAQGFKDREIRKLMLSVEPFQHYPQIIEAIGLDEE